MTSSDDRCPTCDGSGFVARNDQQYPCPTCSLATDTGKPHLTAEPDGSGTLHIARSVAYGLGAAAVIGALAFVVKALWH
jgi:DnaJ-class molecular chaperone